VLGAQGKPGGFSAPGGAAQKERLLRLEGVELLRAGGLAEEVRERSAEAVVARRARSGRARTGPEQRLNAAGAAPAAGFPSLFSSGGTGIAFDAPKVVRALARKLTITRLPGYGTYVKVLLPVGGPD